MIEQCAKRGHDLTGELLSTLGRAAKNLEQGFDRRPLIGLRVVRTLPAVTPIVTTENAANIDTHIAGLAIIS
jgi:hypothetical protein